MVAFNQALSIFINFPPLSFGATSTFWRHAFRVSVLATVTVSAVALLEKFTNLPISVILQEVINDIVVILKTIRYLIINPCIYLNNCAILLNYSLDTCFILKLCLQLRS